MQLDIALHLRFRSLIKIALTCVYKLLWKRPNKHRCCRRIKNKLPTNALLTAWDNSCPTKWSKKTFLAITSSLGWLSNWHRPSLLMPKAKWSWKIISTNPLEQYFISNGKVRAVEHTFLCHLMSLHKVLQNHTLHEYILIYLLKVFTSYRSQRF